MALIKNMILVFVLIGKISLTTDLICSVQELSPFHVFRWGLVQDWTFVHLKRLSVIINDDFFEEGECYRPGTLAYIST